MIQVRDMGGQQLNRTIVRIMDRPTDGRQMTRMTYLITITAVTQNGRGQKVSHNASGYEAPLMHPNMVQVCDMGGQ